MRNRLILAGLLMAGLSACAPSVPNSAAGIPDPGRGVGFNNDVTAARARESQLASRAQGPVEVDGQLVQAPAGAAGPVTSLSRAPQPQPVETARGVPQPVPQARQAQAVPRQTAASRDPELAEIERRADAQARAANSGEAVVNASPSNAAPVIINNPGISSEQDFGSVSARRSIEGDAARLAANRQQYEVVAPTDLPSRRGASEPNVVAYALQTTHPVGTRVHRRVNIASASKFRRNCAAFSSDDDAQAEFLALGGPRRDRKGLDPDGDGYACGWDPAPFRGL